jgi:hypothetical protein
LLAPTNISRNTMSDLDMLSAIYVSENLKSERAHRHQRSSSKSDLTKLRSSGPGVVTGQQMVTHAVAKAYEKANV